jgi:hypothetical protein
MSAQSAGAVTLLVTKANAAALAHNNNQDLMPERITPMNLAPDLACSTTILTSSETEIAMHPFLKGLAFGGVFIQGGSSFAS